VRNPQTQETFVLLPVEEYERLTAAEYDDTRGRGKNLKPSPGKRVRELVFTVHNRIKANAPKLFK
jgi:hypothetical protein